MVEDLPDAESGSALLLALLTVLITTMAVLLVAALIQGRRLAFNVEQRNATLSALVDASMAESLAGLDTHKNFRGVAEHPLDSGLISSTVVFGKVGFRRIAARADFRGWVSVIEARVDIRGGHPIVMEWSTRSGRSSQF